MPENLSMSAATLLNLFLLAAKFGADVFCRMRSYLSTCRENNVSVSCLPVYSMEKYQIPFFE